MSFEKIIWLELYEIERMKYEIHTLYILRISSFIFLLNTFTINKERKFMCVFQSNACTTNNRSQRVIRY